MNLYAFILGRKHLLSIAELAHALGPRARIIDITPHALITDLRQELKEPQESLNRLGGTIKIAKIFQQLPLSQRDLASPISEHLIQEFKDRDSKLSYGLSLYSFPQPHDRQIKNTLMPIKKALKAEGIKSRFINKNFKNPQNAAIAGENLIQDGADMLAIQGQHHTYLGQTIALQDFESYSHRDYDRPARDAKLGMLPPKLAQIMINLSGFTHLQPRDNPTPSSPPPSRPQTLYDPFAGMGTILTEALLLNFNVVGSDINAEILEGAKKNIDWHIQKFPSITTQLTQPLFPKDATAITIKDLRTPPDLIVTESYLGPPQNQLPDPKAMKKNFHHIEETLTRFFRSVHDILQTGTPIVISFAVYRGKKTIHAMEQLPQKITNLGYKIEPLIPKDLNIQFNLKAEQSLIYDRPDQIVGRQIWKFIRT